MKGFGVSSSYQTIQNNGVPHSYSQELFHLPTVTLLPNTSSITSKYCLILIYMITLMGKFSDYHFRDKGKEAQRKKVPCLKSCRESFNAMLQISLVSRLQILQVSQSQVLSYAQWLH